MFILFALCFLRFSVFFLCVSVCVCVCGRLRCFVLFVWCVLFCCAVMCCVVLLVCMFVCFLSLCFFVCLFVRFCVVFCLLVCCATGVLLCSLVGKSGRLLVLWYGR